jgi:hypothetical protein
MFAHAVRNSSTFKSYYQVVTLLSCAKVKRGGVFAMTLKRKPPSGNVRRIAPIEGNLRYTITGKADQTVQCESFQERKLTLLFDRDPGIRTYISQPERLTYLDAAGKTRTYTPDFMVWRVTGEIEIKERGWHYLVHTEATLPQATEEANLLALAHYRPTAYANQDVARFVQERLANAFSPILFRTLVTEMTHTFHLQQAPVVSAMCHLLWHGTLETDLCRHLIFQDATPRATLLVWLRSAKEAR